MSKNYSIKKRNGSKSKLPSLQKSTSSINTHYISSNTSNHNFFPNNNNMHSVLSQPRFLYLQKQRHTFHPYPQKIQQIKAINFINHTPIINSPQIVYNLSEYVKKQTGKKFQTIPNQFSDNWVVKRETKEEKQKQNEVNYSSKSSCHNQKIMSKKDNKKNIISLLSQSKQHSNILYNSTTNSQAQQSHKPHYNNNTHPKNFASSFPDNKKHFDHYDLQTNPSRLSSQRIQILQLSQWLDKQLHKFTNPYHLTIQNLISYKQHILNYGLGKLIEIINKKCRQQANLLKILFQNSFKIFQKILSIISIQLLKTQSTHITQQLQTKQIYDIHIISLKHQNHILTTQLSTIYSKMKKIIQWNKSLRNQKQNLLVKNRILQYRNITYTQGLENTVDLLLKNVKEAEVLIFAKKIISKLVREKRKKNKQKNVDIFKLNIEEQSKQTAKQYVYSWLRRNGFVQDDEFTLTQPDDPTQLSTGQKVQIFNITDQTQANQINIYDYFKLLDIGIQATQLMITKQTQYESNVKNVEIMTDNVKFRAYEVQVEILSDKCEKCDEKDKEIKIMEGRIKELEKKIVTMGKQLQEIRQVNQNLINNNSKNRKAGLNVNKSKQKRKSNLVKFNQKGASILNKPSLKKVKQKQSLSNTNTNNNKSSKKIPSFSRLNSLQQQLITSQSQGFSLIQHNNFSSTLNQKQSHNFHRIEQKQSYFGEDSQQQEINNKDYVPSSLNNNCSDYNKSMNDWKDINKDNKRKENTRFNNINNKNINNKNNVNYLDNGLQQHNNNNISNINNNLIVISHRSTKYIQQKQQQEEFELKKLEKKSFTDYYQQISKQPQKQQYKQQLAQQMVRKRSFYNKKIHKNLIQSNKDDKNNNDNKTDYNNKYSNNHTRKKLSTQQFTIIQQQQNYRLTQISKKLSISSNLMKSRTFTSSSQTFLQISQYCTRTSKQPPKNKQYLLSSVVNINKYISSLLQDYFKQIKRQKDNLPIQCEKTFYPLYIILMQKMNHKYGLKDISQKKVKDFVEKIQMFKKSDEKVGFYAKLLNMESGKDKKVNVAADQLLIYLKCIVYLQSKQNKAIPFMKQINLSDTIYTDPQAIHQNLDRILKDFFDPQGIQLARSQIFSYIFSTNNIKPINIDKISQILIQIFIRRKQFYYKDCMLLYQMCNKSKNMFNTLYKILGVYNSYYWVLEENKSKDDGWKSKEKWVEKKEQKSTVLSKQEKSNQSNNNNNQIDNINGINNNNKEKINSIKILTQFIKRADIVDQIQGKTITFQRFLTSCMVTQYPRYQTLMKLFRYIQTNFSQKYQQLSQINSQKKPPIYLRLTNPLIFSSYSQQTGSLIQQLNKTLKIKSSQRVQKQNYQWLITQSIILNIENHVNNVMGNLGVVNGVVENFMYVIENNSKGSNGNSSGVGKSQVVGGNS